MSIQNTTNGMLFNLPAPAKLNLFLHILGRRSDGYHNLQSAFTLIDLADRIDIECLQTPQVERTGDIIGTPNMDLCVRAAKRLQEKTGCSLGARIHVEKRIPAGAGLGGGSSDAATTLIGLNKLWNLGLSRKDLSCIALSLGADIPFFIEGSASAFVEGIGEIITPINLPQSTYAIIWPGVSSPTARIFSHPNLTRNTKSTTITLFSEYASTEWPQLFGHNDLETVVLEQETAVADALAFLSAHGQARMTGSGSAVFTLCSSRRAAQEVLHSLPPHWAGFIAQGLSEHPLKGWFSE